MSHDPPTASIKGQHEWKWNRWQADRRPRAGLSATGDRDVEPRSPGQEHGTVWRELAALEAELERKECHLQSVIQQYERILSERDQQLAEHAHAGSSGASVRTLYASILQYIGST